ncbi:hypothetical protein [Pseudomonas japonica]|uniref:Uncharacterized protein n=1 Tax=Pseudomonas japonica TaxID=256466 RepID=A0A239GRL2_9PSED|nr:hypothetical protein [Pseudomonas japonica]SNS71601.1 hypothetical protein SAMN05444352_113123 [Pseudomonas japonica]
MNDKTPLAELLQWLAGAPRTYGWSAILAYDRDKTNTVLRQEYIERFDSGSYLPPFRELIPTTDETAEYTYDYIFDAARLSFTNATLKDSKVMLTQKVIGGSQLTLSKPGGWRSARVEKIHSLDAMDGPLLESEVSLQASTGHVNRSGQVILDISTGENPRLTFARTKHEREKGGKHFMARFGEEEEPRRTLVLNEMGMADDQFLKPGKFEIRTHAAPNSRTPGTREYGSGEVLVFIAMEGESNGSLPVDDGDLPFLIPEGCSATVLMGREFLVRSIMLRACEQFAARDSFQYKWVHQGGLLQGLEATAGYLDMGYQRESSDFFAFVEINVLWLPLHDASNFSFVLHQDNFLTVTMSGSTDRFIWVKLRGPNGADKADYVRLDWKTTVLLGLALNPVTGAVELKSSYAVPVYAGVEPLDFVHFLSPVMLNDMTRLVRSMVIRELSAKLRGFGDTVDPVEAFRLNSLLFKGDNSVVLDSVHLPADLALFGHVSPSLTEFVITPLEPIVGHGQREKFDTEPNRNGVTWSVEPLPGESGAVGSIDQNGWYTAPPASAIEGVYKRVKVKATLGQHTSTALVTVVVRDISVNPLVQVCGVGQSRAMSAGTLGDGVLTWKVANPENGATIAPSNEPDVDHLYTAGPYIKDAEFVVDEVVVTNSQTKHQQSAYVIVPHGLEGLQVFYEATANAKQVQCKALFSNGAPTDGFDLEWGLLAGSGSIDGNGLFTVDTTGQHRFAVVSCVWRGPMSMIGYCVLPLPLIPLPDMLKILADAGALLSRPVEEDH